MIDVSIIIVSYNAKDFLKECVDSIRKVVKGVFYEIIIVDNASTDGSPSAINNLQLTIDNLKLMRNKKNLGFSKANNIGVKEAKGRYLLFLNQDTIVYKDTLETLVKFMDENKRVGASTCKVVMPNGEIDDASHRGFPTPWNAFCHFSGLSELFSKSRLFAGYNLGFLNLSKTHEIDALAGAFMLVRKEAGEEVGWWDEDYFFYGEDIDFCYELKTKGWKIYYVPKVSILHYKGVAGGIKSISKNISTATEETKIRAMKARFNAMRTFYKKHYENKYPKLITRLTYFAISLKERFASL